METLSIILWTVFGSLAVYSLITSYHVYKSLKCLTIKLGDLNEDYQEHEH